MSRNNSRQTLTIERIERIGRVERIERIEIPLGFNPFDEITIKAREEPIIPFKKREECSKGSFKACKRCEVITQILKLLRWLLIFLGFPSC